MKTGRLVCGWQIVGLVWLLLVAGEIYGQGDTAFVQPRDWLTGQREELPGWLTEMVAEERFIAVSDPGLKPEIAREQALMRAFFLYALKEGVRVSVVTDYFSYNRKNYEYEQTRDKLISMIRVKAEGPDMKWRIRREWETQYGEIVVEVFPDSVVCDRKAGEIFGELMLVSSGDLRERNEMRCEWRLTPHCPGRIQKSEFRLKGQEDRLQVCRVLNDTLLALPQEGYWYADAGQPGGAKGCRMNHSFWCAQMQSLLYALAGHVYPEVKLKNLEEGYQESGRGLKREVIQSRVAVRAKITGIRDNRLFVEWETKP